MPELLSTHNDLSVAGTRIVFTTGPEVEFIDTPAYSIRMTNGGGDVTHATYALIGSLQNKIKTLKAQISTMETKLDACYYAPGMPGYVDAKESYERFVK